MGLSFVGASSQYLQCATPAITNYPFTVGMWVRLTAAGGSVRTFFHLGDTGGTTDYLSLRMQTTEAVHITASTSAGDSPSAAGTLVGLQWAFILARWISATQRRVSVLQPSSLVNIGQNVSAVSRAPASMDTMAIGTKLTSAGASEFWDGIIAEYWLASGDAFSDGLHIGMDLFRLAYEGPFKYSNINVIDYHSFRRGLLPGGRGEYNLGSPRHIWTAVNGPLLPGVHPPVNYILPNRRSRPAVLI